MAQNWRRIVVFALIFLVFATNIKQTESSITCHDPSLEDTIAFHVNRAKPLENTYLSIKGEGACSFPITTTNKIKVDPKNKEITFEEDEILQSLFNRGICFLYAFEPFEAMDCFALTIDRNPDCPMCYWAFARALSWNYGFLNTLNEARNRSIELMSTFNVTVNETYFIREDYKTLSRLNNTNGIGFYSLSIIDDTINVYNSPYVERCISERMMRDQLSDNYSNFVAQHLMIHSVEDVNNDTDLMYIRDLMSFDVYEKKSPHLEHMLGHIHFLLGDFNMANKTFYTGYVNDLKRFKKLNMPYENNWELFHNIAYLIGNLAMMGLEDEAISFHNNSLNYFVKEEEKKYVLPYDPVCNRVAARQYYQTGISGALSYWYFDQFPEAIQSLQKVTEKFPSTNYTMFYYTTLSKYFNIRFMLNGGFSFDTINSTIAQFESGIYELEKGTVNNEQTYQVLARNIQALQAMLYECRALLLYKFFEDTDGAYKLLDMAIEYEKKIVYNEPAIIPLSINYTKATLTPKYDLGALDRLLHHPLSKQSHKVLYSFVKYYAEYEVDLEKAKSYLNRIPKESVFYGRAASLIPSSPPILLISLIALIVGFAIYMIYLWSKNRVPPTAGGPSKLR